MTEENEAVFSNAYKAIRAALPDDEPRDDLGSFYEGARAMFVFLAGDWAKPVSP